MTTHVEQPTGIGWMKTFEELTGDRHDGQWAGRVLMTLRPAGVPEATSDALLRAAFEECAAAEQGPRALFGEPGEWATGRIEELSLSGASFNDPSTAHRASIVASLGFGALIAVALGGVALLDDGLHTHWTTMGPVLLLGMVVALALYAEVFAAGMRRRAPWQASLLGLVPVLPVIGLLWLAKQHEVDLGVHSTLWWFALAGGFGLLAVLARRLLPADRVRPVVVRDDADWLDQAGAELRRRDDLTERQVVERLAEAREHAAHTGSSLVEEFGNPRGFARSLPANHAVSLRRTAIWMTITAMIDLAIVVDGGFEIWKALVLACLAASAAGFWALSHREGRRARR